MGLVWVLQYWVQFSCVNTVHRYAESSYATCFSVQRLLSALSCFVRLTQGFIKCSVGRHDAGGLWKCVLVCVCSRFRLSSMYWFVRCACAPVCMLLCLHMITCVHLCAGVRARVSFHLFSHSGTLHSQRCASKSAEREENKIWSRLGVRTGRKTREKTRKRVTERVDCGKVALECGACCFEHWSRYVGITDHKYNI